MDSHHLEKLIWTEQDFKIMGWHDARIWGIAMNADNYEFLVDLDYIFKWEQLEDKETKCEFRIAPVTMVFENAHDIVIDLHSWQGTIDIADLHMENPRKAWNNLFTENTFRFECQEGEIIINATGYKMYVRQEPQQIDSQSLKYDERGGVDFERELKNSKYND